MCHMGIPWEEENTTYISTEFRKPKVFNKWMMHLEMLLLWNHGIS